jgi:Phosphodiester glycosidase
MIPQPRIFLKTLLFSSLVCCFPAYCLAEDLDSVRWFQREVGDGVVWNYYLFDDLYGAKQSVSFIEADLSNPNVRVVLPYLASSRGKLSSFTPNQWPNAVGAVNGTYFDTSSGGGGHETFLRVTGIDIPRGDEPTKGPWSYNGAMTIQSADGVEVQSVPPGGWPSDVTSVDLMANGPILSEDGTIFSDSFVAIGSHCTARHPRSVVGITPENHLLLVAIDGRTDKARGMSCEETAQLMVDLGCDDSLNLDGGGSTALWAAGEPYNGVVNYPSDNKNYDHLGERSVSNGIAVTSSAPFIAAWDGRLGSLSSDALTRSGDSYPVTVSYTNLGTETWTTSNVSVVPSRDFGRSSDFVPSGQETTFFTMVPASVATGETATFTLNLTSPDVATDTVYTENFALSSSSVGYFGPADSELNFSVTVRPELTGAPSVMVVQGGASGVNHQWYEEISGSWGNSSVSFNVPGVTNEGTQRYVSATSTGRSARFRPIFDANGVYTVEVAFPSSSNSIAVQYTVEDRNGTSTFDLDQYSGAGQTNQWIKLGEFEFTTESSGNFGAHSITVGNPAATGSRFYSGAVRLDYIAPLEVSAEGWQMK